MILAFKPQFKQPILDGVKIHTVRKDAANRWVVGRVAQMATNVGSTSYDCFLEQPCASVQAIVVSMPHWPFVDVAIDGRKLPPLELIDFIANEGFASFTEFSEWFTPLMIDAPNKVYQGNLIHWTEKRY
jgi:hypothetical protein